MTGSAKQSISPRRRKNGLLRRGACHRARVRATRWLLAMTATPSPHPQKIPLADLDAAVAQDAMRGGGVKIEIRKRKATGELLALQRHGIARAGREGDVL